MIKVAKPIHTVNVLNPQARDLVTTHSQPNNFGEYHRSFTTNVWYDQATALQDDI